MTPSELENLETYLTKLVQQRRPLGGFDTNAEAILALAESMLMVVKHLRKQNVESEAIPKETLRKDRRG